jgi:hypothetical protein
MKMMKTKGMKKIKFAYLTSMRVSIVEEKLYEQTDLS